MQKDAKLNGASMKKAKASQEAWVGMAIDLTQSTKNMTPLHKKYHNQLVGTVSVMHDIYEQTDNIGTEQFQQHDLTKQIATAEKLVAMNVGKGEANYKATLLALQTAQKVAKQN